MIARGQATVELALGALLLVSTVMLTLWLTEVSFLSVKVQEASAAAVWDASGRPVDDFTDPSMTASNYNQLLTGVRQDVGTRYRNFDALGGAGTGTARLFTQGKQLQVRCEATPAAGPLAMAFNVPAFTGYDDGSAVVPGSLNAQLRGWFQPRGATICSASAQASSYQLPSTFADRSRGGFFTEFRKDPVFQLCGAGKAVGNGCNAGYPILLGDWALDGKKNSAIVRDAVLREKPSVAINGPYVSMVQTLFEKSGGYYQANAFGQGASGVLAAQLGQGAPPGADAQHRDRKFYMSYAGSEHDYGDMLMWKTDQARTDFSCRITCHFNTTGTQPANGNPTPASDDWRNLRAPCFLGLGGCE